MTERMPGRNSLPLRRAGAVFAAIGCTSLTACDTPPSFKTTFNFAVVCPAHSPEVDASLFLQHQQLAAAAKMNLSCGDASNKVEPLSIHQLPSATYSATRNIISMTVVGPEQTTARTSVSPYTYNIEITPQRLAEFSVQQSTLNGAPISNIYNPGKFGDQP